MTGDNLLILLILAGSVILFVSEKLRVDLVALLVLVSLILTGLLSPQEAFAGFASPAVITVWSIFIISGALVHSGVADALARVMLQLAGDNPVWLMLMIMVTVGLMSAFMNNVGAVAILLPAVVGIARETNIAPSKLLIPLAFASLLGGNLTLIGTPPNILANDIIVTYGEVAPFGFFDFAWMGLLILIGGIAYMLLLGRHLLPERAPSGDLSKAYPIREYLTEVRLGEDSLLIDQTITQAHLGEQYDLNVIHIISPDSNEESSFPTPERRLKAGDVLLVEGTPAEILKVSRAKGLVPVEDWSLQELEKELPSGTPELVEITLAPRSKLARQTLKQIDFRARFGLNVLAIRHQGESLVTHLAEVPLTFGDALLVQGPPEKINRLRYDNDFLVLDTQSVELRRVSKAPLAIAILLGALIAATTGWLSISTAMLTGALLMVLSGTLNMDEAYQAIDWKSVFLIAGMLPLGIAMEKTGTAALLAQQLVTFVGGWGPLVVLLSIFILTALLTEVISNAAATVLLVPIAIDVARGLDANLQPFVIAVVLAASTSFLMPIGHQVNVLIFGPGGYRFIDYTRVGVWLNLLILILVAIFLPLIWPLYF